MLHRHVRMQSHLHLDFVLVNFLGVAVVLGVVLLLDVLEVKPLDEAANGSYPVQALGY